VRPSVPAGAFHGGVQVLLGHHLAGAGRQVGQHVELLGGQLQQASVQFGLPWAQADLEAPDGQHVGGGGLATPQQGGYAGAQLRSGDGLDHVVVGSAVEGGQDGGLVLAGREHEHRKVGYRPHHLEQVQAVQVGQAEVEHQGVRRVGG